MKSALIFTKKMLIRHEIWCFFDALVLMFLTKFVPTSTNRRQIGSKYKGNLSQLAPKNSPLQKIDANKVP